MEIRLAKWFKAKMYLPVTQQFQPWVDTNTNKSCTHEKTGMRTLTETVFISVT